MIHKPSMTVALLMAASLMSPLAQAQSASAASGSMSSSSMSGKVARADAAFMKQAAENGHAEVESSKVALTKSSNSKVKTFAQQMVDDHTKAGDELTALATSKGVKVSDRPSMTQRGKIKAMGVLNGDSFDRSYANQMGVSAHEDTVKLFQKASTSATDPEVKAFATKTLPTLQHHLEMAQELKTATAATKN